MDASQLSAQQAAEVYKHVRPAFHYLAALQERMEERQFYGSDRWLADPEPLEMMLQRVSG